MERRDERGFAKDWREGGRRVVGEARACGRRDGAESRDAGHLLAREGGRAARGDGDAGGLVRVWRALCGAAPARMGRAMGGGGDGRAGVANGGRMCRVRRRELARLPEQEKLIQAAENAREDGHDESLKGIGQPGTRRVRLGGGVEAGELGGQGKGGMR